MKTKVNIRNLLGKPTSLYEKFHHKTKFKKFLKTHSHKVWQKAWTTIFYKEYPRLDKIVLPGPSDLSHVTLKESLIKRASSREYEKRCLSLEELSDLLFYSAGEHTKSKNTRRFYPSAGARYPLEVYLFSQNTDLPSGVYHYNIRAHSLETLRLIKKSALREFIRLKWVEKASCVLFITACFNRTSMKYGERGYRHVLTEAGHMGQNIYLLCAALNLSCCSIGEYLDDKLNTLLDVDGVQESVISAVAIGAKRA